MSGQLVSIILPVYRQADHIREIVREYCDALNRLNSPFELVLVANGPADATLDACRELERELKAVRVVRSVERGWGRAVRLGLREASGDLLCYTNSARTSSQDLFLMLVYALAYPDVVLKAERKIRDRLSRRLGSLIYNLECRALFDLSYWDINGTPKVFPRSWQKLLQLIRDDDLIDLEFNVICRREGYRVLGVPILSTRRHGGKSTTNIWSAVRMYWGCYKMWRSLRRQRP